MVTLPYNGPYNPDSSQEKRKAQRSARLAAEARNLCKSH